MVSDFNRAVVFYTDTLGLRLKVRFGDDWAEIEAPGLTIGLHPTGERGPAAIQAVGVSIGLGVSGIEQGVADLEAKGVRFAQRSGSFVSVISSLGSRSIVPWTLHTPWNW